MARIDQEGKGSPSAYYKEPLEPDTIACHLLVACSIAQPALMVRAGSITPYRYDTQFGAAEDYELWTRMIGSCRFANLPLALTQYRRHPTQTSTVDIDQQTTEKRLIHGRQITALGMSFNDLDLVRHECLFRFEGRRPVLERTGQPLNLDYVRWCRSWLESMQDGNARIRRYPEPAFSHMIARAWLFACRKGGKNSSWLHVAIEFLQSPLKAIVSSLFIQKLRSFRRTPRT